MSKPHNDQDLQSNFKMSKKASMVSDHNKINNLASIQIDNYPLNATRLNIFSYSLTDRIVPGFTLEDLIESKDKLNLLFECLEVKGIIDLHTIFI